MARSSTSFGAARGNRSAAVPGNKLAVRHGAATPEIVNERLPAIQARVAAELAEVSYLTPPDASLVRTFCYVTAQVELLQEYFDGQGGLFTSRGSPKKGASFMLLLIHRQQEMAKVLGLGPVPRAQMLQAAAGAGINALLVKQAQERLRAKQISN